MQLVESATLFATFEESVCYTCSVRQAVPLEYQGEGGIALTAPSLVFQLAIIVDVMRRLGNDNNNNNSNNKSNSNST